MPARAAWPAPRDSPDSQGDSPHAAIPRETVKHVLAAGRSETASSKRYQGLQHQPVKHHEAFREERKNIIKNGKDHGGPDSRPGPSAFRRALSAAWPIRSKTMESNRAPTGNLAERAETTKSKPTGSLNLSFLNASLNLRRMRFRVTPHPETLFETLKPIREKLNPF